MSVEELRKIAKEEASKFIMENLNSVIIFTYIQNLEKEIEKYKKVIDNRDFTWKQKYEETFEYVNKEFISKDKIREKIKEYKGLKEIDKMAYEEQIKPLQELLEEE